MSETLLLASRAHLLGAVPGILAAPKDQSRLESIVVRQPGGVRHHRQSARLSLAGGVEGDSWADGCWMTTEEGRPHPDVQVAIMATRAIAAMAGSPDRWALSGNNLFVDLDLSQENMPAGTRLAVGSAELIVTAERMTGCRSFIEWYGRDACVFVNTGQGKALNMRGVYARVVRDGEVRVGDGVKKF
jgi:MOSC domain-containing protein YiiM